MFFLASMYFSFPKGYGGPGKCFDSAQNLWFKFVSDDYCVRSFLAKSAGIQTVVLLPTHFGVLELGSDRILPQSFEFLNNVNSFFSLSNLSSSFLLYPSISATNEGRDDESGVSNGVHVPPKVGFNLNNGCSHFREKLAIRKMDSTSSIHFPSSRNRVSGSTSWEKNQVLGEVFGSSNGVRKGFSNYQPQRKQVQMQIDFSGAKSRANSVRPVIGESEVAAADVDADRPNDERRPRKAEMKKILMVDVFKWKSQRGQNLNGAPLLVFRVGLKFMLLFTINGMHLKLGLVSLC